MLRIKSDSMAALGALSKGGSAQSGGMNYLMKEFMLLLAASGRGLRLRWHHVPGTHNEWADALSRLYQPGSGAQVPGPLRDVPRTPAPERSAGWWMVEGPPEAAAKGMTGGVVE